MFRSRQRIAFLLGLACCAAAIATAYEPSTRRSEEHSLLGTWRHIDSRHRELNGLSLTFFDDHTFALEKLNLCSSERHIVVRRGQWFWKKGQCVLESFRPLPAASSGLLLTIDLLLERFRSSALRPGEDALRRLDSNHLEIDLSDPQFSGARYERYSVTASDMSSP